ncbi:MAG: NUDIX domain-containing protein [Pseudomonadota bacterium]
MSDTTETATGERSGQPTPSATVMLVRDADAGVEVLMLRRHKGADFANAWVFPGGLAAPMDFDRSLDPFCSGLYDHQASAQLGMESGGLGLWVAAVRECFEESGLLLARNFEGDLCQPGASQNVGRFEDYRVALANNEMTLREVCEIERLTLDIARLEYVSFWTTPVGLSRRYATRFFVAPVPAHQEGAPDGRETTESRWVSPREVTQTEPNDGLRMHPPTRVNLQWLAQFDDVASVMAAARTMDKQAISEIVPVIDPETDARSVVLPDGTRVPL